MKDHDVIAFLNKHFIPFIFLNQLPVYFCHKQSEGEILYPDQVGNGYVFFRDNFFGIIQYNFHNYISPNKISKTWLASMFATIPTLGAKGGNSSETSLAKSPQI
jgi:hypothetical protein